MIIVTITSGMFQKCLIYNCIPNSLYSEQKTFEFLKITLIKVEKIL